MIDEVTNVIFDVDRYAEDATMPGASDVADFGTTYESDGAALYGSAALSAAALAAMTLY